jgi:hypothetical protein
MVGFMKQVDLHGRELDEALIEILDALRECVAQADSTIEIIHGFHHGTVIKSFLATPKFKDMLRKEGFVLDKIMASKGSMQFHVRASPSSESKALLQVMAPSRPGAACPGCGRVNDRCTCKYCVRCGALILGGACSCTGNDLEK